MSRTPNDTFDDGQQVVLLISRSTRNKKHFLFVIFHQCDLIS